MTQAPHSLLQDEPGLTQELQHATETTINPIKYEGHIQAVEYLKRNASIKRFHGRHRRCFEYVLNRYLANQLKVLKHLQSNNAVTHIHVMFCSVWSISAEKSLNFSKGWSEKNTVTVTIKHNQK